MNANAVANLDYARSALDDIISCQLEKTGDAMVVEIAGRLMDSLDNPTPTQDEMFLAVLVALAVERLREREGFAA